MKDAARLVAYLLGTVLLGCLLAPPLFWATRALAAHGIFPALASVDFDSFFHRALLVGALILLWPLLRSARIRREELGLIRTGRGRWDLLVGFFLACVPLLICGGVLVALRVYSWRNALNAGALAAVLVPTIMVPLIEEVFFRGLMLGLLSRNLAPVLANAVTSAVFAAVHFLKDSDPMPSEIHWDSGFIALAHSLTPFRDPALVLGAFVTLFLIGWILADARFRTQALWLSMGLHAGWIFGNGIFNRLAHRRLVVLPWLGRNLLVGLVPLAVCALTWALVVLYLRRRTPNKT